MIECPYCRVPARRVDSANIYHGRSFGLIYLCTNYPQCDARVGAHSRTKRPLGTMARKTLRGLRRECHAKFDPLWKDGTLTRSAAYQFLERLMRVGVAEAHIARFDERRCRDFLARIDCPTCCRAAREAWDFYPSHEGSSSCRNHRLTGNGAIAAGGAIAHCTCRGCF